MDLLRETIAGTKGQLDTTEQPIKKQNYTGLFYWANEKYPSLNIVRYMWPSIITKFCYGVDSVAHVAFTHPSTRQNGWDKAKEIWLLAHQRKLENTPQTQQIEERETRKRPRHTRAC